MIAVGIRELKDRLSEYVRRARAGEEVLITDRGEVVAELRAPRALASDPETPGGLGELVRVGGATPGGPNASGLYPALEPLLPPEAVRELLDAERGET